MKNSPDGAMLEHTNTREGSQLVKGSKLATSVLREPPLNSIDLFTGLGGFTLATAFATPILYCDNSPYVRATLASLFKKGVLPEAPVVDDVCDLDAIKAAVGGRKVHLLTMGFPCTGFSGFGSKQGLGNEQSALFHDAMRVITALDPDMTLFENVASILNTLHSTDLAIITDAVIEAGYDVRWTTCSAGEVGAPQRRDRWFCLATKRGRVMPEVDLIHDMLPTWSSLREPPLMVPRVDLHTHAKRYHMLGNTIVPLAAKLAFFRMYSGYRINTVYDLMREPEGPMTFEYTVHGEQEPRTGVVYPHAVLVASLNDSLPATCIPQRHVRKLPPPVVDIIAHPGHYMDVGMGKIMGTPDGNGVISDSPLVRGVQGKTGWPTPRSGNSGASHRLSQRVMADLPTLARFAQRVNGVDMPRTTFDDAVNIEWVEWLMGYGKGYTLATV